MKKDHSRAVIRVIIAFENPVIGYVRAIHSASEEQVIGWEGPPGGASVPGWGLGKGPPHEKNRGFVRSLQARGVLTSEGDVVKKPGGIWGFRGDQRAGCRQLRLRDRFSALSSCKV